MSTNERTDLSLPVRNDADLMSVRQRVRGLAQDLGFGLVQQTKLVTAASELARNTLVHGGGGHVTVEAVTDGNGGAGVTLVFTDQGPGIADVDRALDDGYSTAGGLGMGLSGSKRLVDDFSVRTAPGEGTAVTITLWSGPRTHGLR
ncbi:anti-sigma regulatory factor [Nocardiopsis sp. L17-MgMaSL7]|uniref:anti-sigma regulatory factor n=1 Tax=Nocardiopsis sp. L17-MgMaSL7 TaxID=1938893 RepID=UPI000D8E14E6|nr:anti-sigma regulatory factor [Nocardiopsis sp. L17-MgMaSL7]PWV44927.1 serine/threonine-protein kinase RsbT [Nocardiopsis sp. L17-MgMaSL7]